jgi:hypothetical protein
MKTATNLKFVSVLTLGMVLGLAAPQPAEAALCDLATQQYADAQRAAMIQAIDNSWWANADTHYLNMVGTGCTPMLNDHNNGAWAILNLGDVATAIARYNLAGSAHKIEELEYWYREVDLDFRTTNKRTLSRSGDPLSPVGNAVFLRAKNGVETAGKYHGYLPEGTYSIGNVGFQIELGGGPVLVIP